MGLLLDTAVLIQGFSEPELLPVALVRDLREAGGRGEIFVSVASYWEIAIKSALGKLTAPPNFPERVAAHADFTLLSITGAHAWRVRDLPAFADHKDPFDRLLIAQAIEERLTIVTPDPHFARYGVTVLW